MILSSLLVGLLPIVLFLVGLMVMDSYQLVTRRAVARSMAAGVVAATVAFLLNRQLLLQGHVELATLRREIAPVLEELLKAAWVVWLIRRERVGFMVDAGIHGFAVGAGFALVENVYYAGALGDHRLLVWLVRGLGTAVMHGSTTAIAAILTKSLADRFGSHAVRWSVPGVALAVVVHSVFNHLPVHPLVLTALLLVCMPLLLVVVFEQSERVTRAWLGSGMDSDIETLETLLQGEVHQTPVGRYLESLKTRFAPVVVADMLCLLRVHLELSLSAKGILMARSVGVEIPVDDDVRANLDELRYLERAIGPTGWLALLPFVRTTRRDLWQIHMLGSRR
jgi:RsiW-degrading membrane proteinase PrsW (M82 family)